MQTIELEHEPVVVIEQRHSDPKAGHDVSRYYENEYEVDDSVDTAVKSERFLLSLAVNRPHLCEDFRETGQADEPDELV